MTLPHTMIATLPRSGTWFTRYFLLFFDHFFHSGDEPPLILDVYERATRVSKEFTVADQAVTTISHWLCPGVFNLDSPLALRSLEFFEQKGALGFHKERDAWHAAFKPPVGRVIYIFRHPLDVYRSYAEMHERRSTLSARAAYPFNPMVPFGDSLFNDRTVPPFEFFIDRFAESGFAEYFAAQYAAFLAVQDAYPEHVTILRFEDSMADTRAHFVRLLALIGVAQEIRGMRALDRGLDAVRKDKMRRPWDTRSPASSHSMERKTRPTFLTEVSRGANL